MAVYTLSSIKYPPALGYYGIIIRVHIYQRRSKTSPEPVLLLSLSCAFKPITPSSGLAIISLMPEESLEELRIDEDSNGRDCALIGLLRLINAENMARRILIYYQRGKCGCTLFYAEKFNDHE